MTIDDFFAALEAEAPRVPWKRQFGGAMYRTHMEGKWGCYCPLTFLCKLRCGPDLSVDQFGEAAPHLHLPYDAARQIVQAVDGLPIAKPALVHRVHSVLGVLIPS